MIIHFINRTCLFLILQDKIAHNLTILRKAVYEQCKASVQCLHSYYKYDILEADFVNTARLTN